MNDPLRDHSCATAGDEGDVQGAWFSTKSGERFCDDVCGRSQTNAECSAAHVPRSHGSRYSKPVQCGQARDFERGKRVCSAWGTETCMSHCVLHGAAVQEEHTVFLISKQHITCQRVVSADSKQLHDTQRHGVVPRLRKSAQHTGHLYQGVARWPVTLTRPWPGQGCATLHLVVLTKTVPTQDTRHTHTLTTSAHCDGAIHSSTNKHWLLTAYSKVSSWWSGLGTWQELGPHLGRSHREAARGEE
jgi:hypothetical protein